MTYIDELNKCIEASRATGYARVSPEKGLNYMCFRGEGAVEQIEEEAVRDCIVVILNERKTFGEWAPYYPFTLSIRDAEALFDFIEGNYSLLVAVHVPTLIDHFKRLGLTAEFIEDDDYAIQLGRPGAVVGRDLVSKLSRQVFARTFFELQSLSWFARMQSEGFEQIERDGLPFADKADAAVPGA